MKLPKDRIPYSAIVDRPTLKLPDGARIAVWTIVNVEELSIERNMPRTVLSPPYGQPLQPDLPNWAWHEYGMRVGFWRFLEALKKYNVKATLAINGSVCTSYPRVATAALEAGWEFMGHGFIQRPMHHLENQKEEIFKAVETFYRRYYFSRRYIWKSIKKMASDREEAKRLLSEGRQFIGSMWKRRSIGNEPTVGSPAQA